MNLQLVKIIVKYQVQRIDVTNFRWNNCFNVFKFVEVSNSVLRTWYGKYIYYSGEYNKTNLRKSDNHNQSAVECTKRLLSVQLLEKKVST